MIFLKKRTIAAFLGTTALFGACSTQQNSDDPYAGSGSDYDLAVQARGDSLIDYYVASNAAGHMQAAARYHRGVDIERANEMMDSLAMRQEAEPSGDMFWMYPQTVAMFEAAPHMTPEQMARQRNLWKIYPPYRGDTENHWAMYYASMYLVTQMFPDDPGAEWFNGRSSQENFEEARDYIYHWMDLTTTIGQGEYDSPGYYPMYVGPMSMLYAYATDAEMKKRAGMMLEFLLADFAVENLNGEYLGAHSRVYPQTVHQQWTDNATTFAWLFFGNTPVRYRGESLISAFSGFRPSEIIRQIATDRSQPYEHFERKRTRHRIRYSDLKNKPVYKTMYMTADYGLGSTQGGRLQPIQQQTWDFTWAQDDVTKGYNMIYSMHPYSSGTELAMYFPEEPKLLTEAVVKSKGTYDSPDKWTGGSPFEQVYQHKDALIALYDIPEGERFPHISGFFSKSVNAREVDPSGWIFVDAGRAYLAWYPMAPYEWQEEENNWRLHSTHLKNGAVVQVARASDYASFGDFKQAVLALPIETSVDSLPSARFTTLGGDEVVFTYGNTPNVNGVPVDYNAWPLYGGPFLNAEVGSKKLTLSHGSRTRVLDFTNGSITDGEK